MLNKIFIYLFLVCFNSLYSQSWNKLGGGNFSYGLVSTLDVSNNALYVGGGFESIDGITVNGIAKWNDTIWSGLDEGLSSIKAIKNYNNEIYVGGSFQRFLGSFTVQNLAVWNEINWDKVGEPSIGNTTSGVRALAVYKNNLYVGGVFTTIGSSSYERIARWDGSQWHDVGGGIAGGVPSPGPYCMTVYNNELIVGGRFGGSNNGVSSENIIKWDGIQWKTFDYGLDGHVFDMVVDTVDNVLYVCGIFYSSVSTGLPCKFVAGWDGSEWFSLGNTTDNYHGLNGNVLALEIYNNKLFAGGSGDISSITDTTLSCWDGSTWEPVLGPNAEINTLKVYNGKLYVGGGFNQIWNDTSIKYLASYYDTIIGHLSTDISKNQLSVSNNQLSIYPNPTDSQFTIEAQFQYGKESIIKVFNIKGEIIKEFNLCSGKNILSLNVSDWGKGIYVCVLEREGDQVDSKRFVVQ